jgi:hypothetical protein
MHRVALDRCGNDTTESGRVHRLAKFAYAGAVGQGFAAWQIVSA